MKLHYETDTLKASLETAPSTAEPPRPDHVSVVASLVGTIPLQNVATLGEVLFSRLISLSTKKQEICACEDDNILQNMKRLLGIARDSDMSRRTFDLMMAEIVDEFYGYEGPSDDERERD